MFAIKHVNPRASKRWNDPTMTAKDGVRFRFQQYQHDYSFALQKVQRFV